MAFRSLGGRPQGWGEDGYNTMIDSRCYYYLINKSANKALSFRNVKDQSKQGALLADASPDSLEEVWMLKKTHFEGAYYISHCLTGLVLEKTKGKLELHHQHEKNSQYFILVQASGEKEEVWIEEYTQPTNLVSFDKTLNCTKVPSSTPEVIWRLKRVLDNDPINLSCIVSCQYSGYVIQADPKTEKEGKSVRKASWTGQFSQRWEIKRVNAFYTIRNMKSRMLVSLNEKKLKEGSVVILASQNNNFHYQLWSLEQRGHNTYSIKSAYHEQLYIGTKEHNLTEGCELILVKNEYKNLWKVIGAILV